MTRLRNRRRYSIHFVIRLIARLGRDYARVDPEKARGDPRKEKTRGRTKKETKKEGKQRRPRPDQPAACGDTIPLFSFLQRDVCVRRRHEERTAFPKLLPKTSIFSFSFQSQKFRRVRRRGCACCWVVRREQQQKLRNKQVEVCAFRLAM